MNTESPIREITKRAFSEINTWMLYSTEDINMCENQLELMKTVATFSEFIEYAAFAISALEERLRPRSEIDCYSCANTLMSDRLICFRACADHCRRRVGYLDADLVYGVSEEMSEAVKDNESVQLWSVTGKTAFEVIYKVVRSLIELVDNAVPEGIPKSLEWVFEDFDERCNRAKGLVFISVCHDLGVPTGVFREQSTVSEFVSSFYRLLGEPLPQFWSDHSVAERIGRPPVRDVSKRSDLAQHVSERADLVTARRIAEHARVHQETFLSRVRLTESGPPPTIPKPKVEKRGSRPAEWSYQELLSPPAPFRSIREEFPHVAWPDQPGDLGKR